MERIVNLRTGYLFLAVITASNLTASLGATLKVPADFATIQAAIDASNNSDVIEVSKGTYEETLSISSKTDLTIQAKGKVYVDGLGSTSNLLGISNSSQIHIKKIRFRNAANNGISIAVTSDVTLEKCHVQDVGGVGILLFLDLATTVKKCKVANTGDHGIEMASGSNIIQDCTVMNTAGDGISVHGDSNTIEGNTVVGSALIGISLGTDDTQTDQCLVANNTIVDAGGDGIRLENDASACFILDNKISDPFLGDSIDVNSGSDDHVIARNTCTANPFNPGIEIDGTGCIVDGNSLKKCQFGLIIEGNADAALVIDNKIKKSGIDGLEVATGTHTFVRNHVTKSGGFDLDDNAGSGINAFLKNTFGTTDI